MRSFSGHPVAGDRWALDGPGSGRASAGMRERRSADEGSVWLSKRRLGRWPLCGPCGRSLPGLRAATGGLLHARWTVNPGADLRRHSGGEGEVIADGRLRDGRHVDHRRRSESATAAHYAAATCGMVACTLIATGLFVCSCWPVASTAVLRERRPKSPALHLHARRASWLGFTCTG